MQVNMPKKGRYWVLCAVLAAGSVVAAWSLDEVPFFQNLNLKAYDAHFIVRGWLHKPPSIPKIILLVADQKAMDTFPELQALWHLHYAQAIRGAGLGGAKVIGLDLAFAIPIERYEKDYDRVLGEAVSTSPIPVVCGYVAALTSSPGAQAIPINMLAAAMGLAGFVNLTVDPDEFYRRQELVERPSNNPDETPAHSLALRVAEKYLGQDAEFRNGRLVLNGHAIPISRERSILINYAGPPDTFDRVSLADFEHAAKTNDVAMLRRWVKDKIVLIGTDFAGVDRFATPFFTLFAGSRWNTAGVEIHANTVRTLLDRRFLIGVPNWLRLLTLITASFIAVLVATSAVASRAIPLLLLEIVAILIFTHLLFESGLIISTSEIILATLICAIASVVYRFATAEKRGILFRRAIALFVGKQVATSLDETETIALSGKRLEVTILFTDIRGFTAFTEQMSAQLGPEAVVQMLNEYMAAMVAIIVKHHGHVNKFIGDGILAVFSDDDEETVPGDHPLRAVRCATEMVIAPLKFQTGAGIHTGPAVVGNVGSADKMEYTVLGDTVNLASRLESLNKEHHTKLLMSGATQSRLGNAVETVYLADAPVRGKALPISLYTVAALLAKVAVNA
jgi:adenylate cyclase